MRSAIFLLPLLIACDCGSEPTTDSGLPGKDASPPADAMEADAAELEPDASPSDAEAEDANAIEADAGEEDASEEDASEEDASEGDASPDAASPDAAIVGPPTCLGFPGWPLVNLGGFQWPVGVTMGEFDGDGNLDLAVIRSQNGVVQVAFGRGDGSFAEPVAFDAGLDPTAIAAADLNDDGRTDLVVTNGSLATASVLFNDAAPGAAVPSFLPRQAFATGPTPRSIAIADFDGDARPDLATANATGASISVLSNLSTSGSTVAAFSARVDFSVGSVPSSIAAVDLNTDGAPDLVTADTGDDSLSLLINQALTSSIAPTFANRVVFAAGPDPVFVASGDFDRDGMPDLVVADHGANEVSVHLNTTAAGAPVPSLDASVPFSTPSFPNWIVIADVNADARDDLVVADDSGRASILLDTGNAAPSFSVPFNVPARSYSRGIAAGDVDGDGAPDFALISASFRLTILHNTTPAGAAIPTFPQRIDLDVNDNDITLASGDMNGDGRPDLVSSTYAGPGLVSVLLNTTTSSSGPPTFAARVDFPLAAPGSGEIALGDLNGDGTLDVAAAGGSTLAVLLNTTPVGATTPSLAPRVEFTAGSGAFGIALGDVDGDGRLDVGVANREGDGSVTVLLNAAPIGSATPMFSPGVAFSTVPQRCCVQLMPHHAGLRDLNADGRADLLIENSGGPLDVRISTTTAGAQLASFGPAMTSFGGGFSLALGDLDADGDADVVLGELGIPAGVFVLLNTTPTGAASASFTALGNFGAGPHVYGVAIADVNGDGLPDLTTANLDGSAGVLLNITMPGDPAPSFARRLDFFAGAEPYAIAPADFNADGRIDLAVAVRDEDSISVLVNDCVP